MFGVQTVGLALLVAAAVAHAQGDGSGSGSTNASVYDQCAKTPDEEKICGRYGDGVILPLFENEWNWPKPLRIVLYLIGLLWAFAGVGEVTDTFMCAIETITAKERVHNDNNGEQHIVKVWNPTVANLTLMALGSSAPEILLGIIEICFSTEFYAGDLGPGTIVGSAAFNLFVIIAVCTMSLKEYKRIHQHSVYVLTMIFSIFAYLWIVIVIMGISPNIVSVGEAVVTVLFFPILCITAYLIDSEKLNCFGYIKKVAAARRASKVGMVVEVTTERGTTTVGKYEGAAATAVWNDVVETRKALQAGSGQDATDDTAIAQPLTSDEKETLTNTLKTKAATRGQSRAAYRVQATRKLKGQDMEVTEEHMLGVEAAAVLQMDDNPIYLPEAPTFDGDHDAVGTVTFAKAKCEMLEGGSEGSPRNPDNNNAFCYIAVQRVNCGKNAEPMKVTYSTIPSTAIADKDFVSHTDVELVFNAGETQKIIQIEIIDDDIFEKDEHFFVQLYDPTPRRRTSVSSSQSGVGSEDKTILGAVKRCQVDILNDDDISTFAGRVTAMLSFNKHKFRLGRDQWGGSICECFTFPRGEGVGKQVGWFVMLPWAAANVLLVPPTTIWGGWPTFCLSLGLTGFTTALIGDLASLFGCVTGVSDPITAITFVALGTSLPDTFASRTAALNEPDADAAITNVTGSNSVNVFLGLGLTWMIGSCYWATLDDPEKLAEWKTKVPADIALAYPNGAFYLNAGNLGFSVIIFTASSLMAFAVLHIRRMVPRAYPGEEKDAVVGGELGGPGRFYVGGFLISLWFMYVILSSLKSEGMLGGPCAR